MKKVTNRQGLRFAEIAREHGISYEEMEKCLKNLAKGERYRTPGYYIQWTGELRVDYSLPRSERLGKEVFRFIGDSELEKVRPEESQQLEWRREGRWELFEIAIFEFDHEITPDAAEEEIDSEGYCPADIDILLAFIAEHREGFLSSHNLFAPVLALRSSFHRIKRTEVGPLYLGHAPGWQHIHENISKPQNCLYLERLIPIPAGAQFLACKFPIMDSGCSSEIV